MKSKTKIIMIKNKKQLIINYRLKYKIKITKNIPKNSKFYKKIK